MNKLKECPLELLWEKEIEEGISKVVFADGNIVVGIDNGWVKCFGLDGNLKWKHKTKSMVHSIDIKRGNIVISASDNVYFYESNGRLKWNVKIGKNQGHVSNSLLYTNNKEGVVVLFWNEHHESIGRKYPQDFYHLDFEGNIKWIKVEEPVIVMDVSDEYFAYGSGGCFRVLDLNNGNRKWEVIPDKGIHDDINMVKIFNGYVSFSCDSGDFYIFNLEHAIRIMKYDEILWGHTIYSDPQKNNIALVSSDGEIVLLNIKEKRSLWKWQIYNSASNEYLDDDIFEEFFIESKNFELKNISDSCYILDNYRWNISGKDHDRYVMTNLLWNIDPNCFSKKPITNITKPLMWKDFVILGTNESYIYIFDIKGNLHLKQRICKENGCIYSELSGDYLLCYVDIDNKKLNYLYLFKLKNK